MDFMKRIGTQLVIRIAVVVTLIMVIAGVMTVNYQRTSAIRFLEMKADRTIQQLMIGLRNPIWAFNLDQVAGILRSYLRDPDILSIDVIETFQNERTYLGKDLITSEIVDLTGENAIVYTEVFTPHTASHFEIAYENQIIGTGDITFSRQFITSQVWETGIVISGVLAALITIETLMILWVVKREISTPLQLTVQAAEQISQGNFDILLPCHSRNEIGVLNATFVSMSRQLKTSFHERNQLVAELRDKNEHLEQEIGHRQQAQEALRTLNEELEERVKARTAELARANDEIHDLNEQLNEENLRMRAELDVAQRLQQMILPKADELRHFDELDIVGFMQPAGEVGGGLLRCAPTWGNDQNQHR